MTQSTMVWAFSDCSLTLFVKKFIIDIFCFFSWVFFSFLVVFSMVWDFWESIEALAPSQLTRGCESSRVLGLRWMKSYLNRGGRGHTSSSVLRKLSLVMILPQVNKNIIIFWTSVGDIKFDIINWSGLLNEGLGLDKNKIGLIYMSEYKLYVHNFIRSKEYF